MPEQTMPKFYGKSVPLTNSAGAKKQGGGKANWGREGDELEDMSNYRPTKPRRRTNSFTAAGVTGALRTKFEAADPEVIEYDEDLHGPGEELGEQNELEKMSSSSSAGTMGSVEEEDAVADADVQAK